MGDVVSVLDANGGVYFAIIRGFLQDQYAEKYAILTWLLPRHPNPTHFDPSNFVLGEFFDSTVHTLYGLEDYPNNLP